MVEEEALDADLGDFDIYGVFDAQQVNPEVSAIRTTWSRVAPTKVPDTTFKPAQNSIHQTGKSEDGHVSWGGGNLLSVNSQPTSRAHRWCD
jgi:hypothetical protein